MKFITEQKHIKLNIADKIIDEECRILTSNICNHLKIGMIVRISYHVASESRKILKSFIKNCPIVYVDSPYVIIERKSNNLILGRVLKHYRNPYIVYPLNAGEKIWFKKNNIIEIDFSMKENINKISNLNTFKTKESVEFSGIFHTINFEENMHSASDSSDSEVEEPPYFDDTENMIVKKMNM